VIETWEEGDMAGIEARAGLTGRKAAVVGGGYGLGRAVSLALAECGVHVAICDIDAEALPGTVADAQKAGVTAFGEAFDAMDTERLKAFYGQVAERFGHLDIVVNVVGGANMGFLFADTEPEDWALDIHRNFGVMLHSCKSSIPLLRKSGKGGSIINFTTIEAHRGAASIAVYAGAKAATENFSRALANELGREKIRVNTVAPDMTPSRGNDQAVMKAGLHAAMGDLSPEILAAGTAMAVPMGKPPSPDEVANAVVFLASDLASSITGSTMHAEGGTFAASGFLQWSPGRFSPLPPPKAVEALRGAN